MNRISSPFFRKRKPRVLVGSFVFLIFSLLCTGTQSKADMPRVETPKAEMPRLEKSKAEMPRLETSKAETPTSEMSKAEQDELFRISGWSAENQKWGLQLTSAQNELKAKRSAECLRILKNLSSQKLNVELRSAWFLLITEALEAQGDFPGVVVLFERWEKDLLDELFPKERAHRFVRAAAESGLWQSAVQRVKRDWRHFDDDFLPPQLELSLVSLALRMTELGEPVPFLEPLFHNFPATSESVKAFGILDELNCRQQANGQEGVFSSKALKREHAMRLFRRFGTGAGLQSYVYNLLGWQDNSPQLAAATESPKKQLELLQLAEDMQVLREPSRVLALVRGLGSNPKLAAQVPRDRILFLEARSLNGMMRPDEASARYLALTKKFPRSQLARTAEERRLLSLHYQKKYGEVIAALESPLSKLLKDPRFAWRGFWAAYLKGDVPALKRFAARFRNNQDALNYWMERKGLSIEPSSVAVSSIYGVHRRSRRVAESEGPDLLKQKNRTLKDGGKSEDVTSRVVSKKGIRLAARSGWPDIAQKGSLPLLRRIAKTPLAPLPAAGLIALDFGPVAAPALMTLAKSERDGRSLEALLSLLVLAGDPGAASRTARNRFSTLSERPKTEVELAQSLNEWSSLWKLSFPLAYKDEVLAASEEFDVDPFLLWSLMRTESNYNAGAVSGVGARGLVQIMPGTGQKIAQRIGVADFEVESLNRPSVNIRFAAWYVRFLADYFGGQELLAIAAYNAGPEAVARWIKQSPEIALDEFLENMPFEETRDYVKKVMAAKDMYLRIYGPRGSSAFTEPQAPLPLKLPEVKVF